MKKIEREIVKLLSENARYSFKQIGDMLGEDEKTVEKTVEKLEKDGLIVKYTAILSEDAEKEGTVQALIEVKVAPQKLKGFDAYAESICDFEEVQSLYLMSGGFDLAVFIKAASLADVAKFVSSKLSVIDGIVGVQTHFILKKYKIEGQTTKISEDGERQIIQA